MSYEKLHIVIVRMLAVSVLPAVLTGCPKRGPSPAPVRSDISTAQQGGSCLDFNYYVTIEGVEVEDPQGRKQKRAGKGAATGYNFLVRPDLNPEPAAASRESGSTVLCGCTGREYPDAQSCLAECTTSLGCFTNICGPGVSSERVCVATRVRMLVEAENVRIFLLTWNPPRGTSEECLAAKARYDERLLAHEVSHRAIILDIADEANMAWADGKELKACATSEGEARQQLAAMIDQAADSEIERLKSSAKRRSDEFHQQEPHDAPVDCNDCP